ncbi:MAG TPA: hypothetical protein VMU65_06010 [Candidatus Saccharimonadales bacterium]|nr:hypothetical protein [Candidatus Saccharimonadales bacterium]
MTLIISCITADFVVQASDRRVTVPGQGRGDDRANKAIFYCGQSAWAYTGIAQIGAMRTDEWLVDHFYQHDKLQEAMTGMAKRLDGAMARLSHPREAKRLAVVGVGFARFPQAGHQPYLAWVSDSLDPPHAWRARPRTAFAAHISHLPADRSFAIASYGQRLPAEGLAELRRAVQRVLDHGSGPIAVARLTTELIQAVAATNQAVGDNVMCMILTRDGVTPGNPSIRTLPIPLVPGASHADRFRVFNDYAGEPICTYIPGNPEAVLFYGPMSVCKDVAMWAGAFGPTQALASLPSGNPFPPYSLSFLR